MSLLRKSKMQYRKLGEASTKYFFQLNKEKHEPQVISALQDKNGEITTKTREMGKIATEYHEDLQARPQMTEERRKAIKKLLETSKRKLSNESAELLNQKITIENIKESLKESANGSSPGQDGIPFEFYKQFKYDEKDYIRREKKAKLEGTQPPPEEPDIEAMLTIVINDIEKRGIINRRETDARKQNFNDAVMSLLYKKKDITKIENYRPITLLNCDYKLYTKAISIKLGKIAPDIIHEDQAGFVPKRSLYDHTKTTQTVIEYCQVTKTTGCIVALDQEKAYDKIDHDYLWAVMKHNEFPETFINKIKEMYKNAGKAIMINGCLNKKYNVERGVHQGDPMSCLLYNIAIEPLADAIRESELKGIKLGDAPRNLKVHLFADDTLVYLSKKDSIKILNKILKRFCDASTAKFNLDKTEYLPLGSKNKRNKMINNRKFNGYKFPENTRIVKDNELMRTLGAWVSNEAEPIQQWEDILKKQQKTCDKWKKNNLSMKGKELILKALTQSRAIFLATVNGLPKEVEEQMDKIFKDFVWEGKRATMAWEQIIAPRKIGGLAMPDIKARAEAIQIMWLAKWLAPPEKRPIWAYGMDHIIAKNCPKWDIRTKTNWALQTWHECGKHDSPLATETKKMLNTARKYNISTEAAKISERTKLEWPIWFHRHMPTNHLYTKKSAKEILDQYGIRTVGELIDLPENTPARQKSIAKSMLENIAEIANPKSSTPKKVKDQNLELTPHRKFENTRKENKQKTFDPNVTEEGNPLSIINMFGKEKSHKIRRAFQASTKPAYRDETNANAEKKIVTLYTKHQSDHTLIIAWYEKNSPLNKALKIRKNTSDLKSTIIAITWIAEEDKHNELIIKINNMTAVRMLTTEWEEHQKQGWIYTENELLWKDALNSLRQRTSKTQLEHYLPATLKTEGEIDNIIETNKETPITEWNYIRDSRFEINGVKLTNMTQKLAYDHIIKMKMKKPGGILTQRNLKNLARDFKQMKTPKPTDREIWRGIKEISPPRVSDFIWKITHGRIKCRRWFKKIPGWEDKQYCPCGEVEDLDHILLECEYNGSKKLWAHVSETWNSITKEVMLTPNMSIISGIQTIKQSVTTDDGSYKDVSKLYTEFIMMAIWSIWRIRNKRVFDEIKESDKAMIDLWNLEIKTKLEIEFDSITLVQYKKRETQYKHYEDTWCIGNIRAETYTEKDQKKIRIKIGKDKEETQN